jgi:hypothetical protein
VITLKHDAGARNMPNGLPVRKNLAKLAGTDAAVYFNNWPPRRPAAFPA